MHNFIAIAIARVANSSQLGHFAEIKTVFLTISSTVQFEIIFQMRFQLQSSLFALRDRIYKELTAKLA